MKKRKFLLVKKRKGFYLVIIDPQNDFMGYDDGTPYSVGIIATDRSDNRTVRVETADLPVPGSISDMERLARFIDEYRSQIKGIIVTMCNHQVIDVGHARMWMDKDGKSPAKFTQISEQNIKDRVWTPRDLKFRRRMIKYAHDLALSGNPGITVWSNVGHCRTGTWGQNIYPAVADALQRWQWETLGNIDYVFKGDDTFTEHYGAFMADVPNKNPRTRFNVALFKKIVKAIRQGYSIVGAGEALTHCIRASFNQLTSRLAPAQKKAVCLLTDCMSPVGAIPGVDFPALGQEWLRSMKHQGVKLATSKSISL